MDHTCSCKWWRCKRSAVMSTHSFLSRAHTNTWPSRT